MIKNRPALESQFPHSEHALDMLEAGLNASMPENFMLPHLEKFSRKKIHIISYGKAAYTMALTASKHIKVAGGLIVAPKGKRMNAIPGLQMHYAAHPIPDRCSTTAAHATIKYLEQIDPKDHVLFLISGGGSSLLSLPPKSIKFDDLLSATRLLLASGAKISEINCIRRHISQVAGGRLTSFMKCHADALIISDVPGNHIQDISSGCTAPDCTSFEDALQYIRLLHLESAMPKSVMMQLRNGASGIIPDGPSKTRVKNHVIASGLDCAKAVTKKARLSKLRVHIMQVYGDVKSESEKIASCTKSGENSCIVFYGEPTVNLQGKGSGGRNQELVLRLIALYKRKNMRCIVASMGTDGIDGNTKYAGAIYDTARSCSITEITRFLKENDSSSFFAKHGGHILTGLTGTNLADVGFVIVRKVD